MDSASSTKILYGLIGILLITTFVFAFNSFSFSPATASAGLQYKGIVCTSVDRVDGTHEDLGCNSNLLVNAGANAIRDILGGQAEFGAFDYIGLCNATSPGCTGTDVADTTLDSEYEGSGLNRTQGTYAEVAGVGNWSVAHTFTATADNVITNQTGLFNDTTGGTMLAENTFTLVTLQTNDQLTINWTITASDGGA